MVYRWTNAKNTTFLWDVGIHDMLPRCHNTVSKDNEVVGQKFISGSTYRHGSTTYSCFGWLLKKRLTASGPVVNMMSIHCTPDLVPLSTRSEQ